MCILFCLITINTYYYTMIFFWQYISIQCLTYGKNLATNITVFNFDIVFGTI